MTYKIVSDKIQTKLLSIVLLSIMKKEEMMGKNKQEIFQSSMLAVLITLISTVAFGSESGGYVSASFISVDYSNPVAEMSDGVAEELEYLGYGGSVASTDDRDSGFRIAGGYKVSKYFKVELGYQDLGSAGFKVNTYSDSVSATVDLNGFDIRGTGLIPVTEKFSLFASFGLLKWNFEGEIDIASGGTYQIIDESDTDPLLGVGLAYSFNKKLAVRGNFDRYTVAEEDIDVTSVGMDYFF